MGTKNGVPLLNAAILLKKGNRTVRCSFCRNLPFLGKINANPAVITTIEKLCKTTDIEPKTECHNHSAAPGDAGWQALPPSHVYVSYQKKV